MSSDTKGADCLMMCEHCKRRHVRWHHDVLDAEVLDPKRQRRYTAFSCKNQICVGKARGETLDFVGQLGSIDIFTVVFTNHCAVVPAYHRPAVRANRKRTAA